MPNRGQGRGRSGSVGGTKMSPTGVKVLKFCKKYIFHKIQYGRQLQGLYLQVGIQRVN